MTALAHAASPPPVGSPARYLRFAERLLRGGLLSDPWLDGSERFDLEPLRLPRASFQALCRAAEAVTAVHDQVVRICLREPRLYQRYFHPTPWQRRIFTRGAPLWHGLARADVFVRKDGIAVCELNCDTPSGEAEAVTLGELARAQAPPGSVSEDPCESLGPRFLSLLERMAGRPMALPGAAPLRVGLLYPTELTEDLSMIALYRRWIEERGGLAVLGSPFNLSAGPGGGVRLLGERVDVVVRHYKTDWWCEGQGSPFVDDDPAPAWSPLAAQLELLLGPGAPPVINPFASIVPQNKRSMALMWEERERFPAWAREAIARHVPPSFRLEAVPRARLLAERTSWVLKSDYGCEGAEVIVGASVSRGEWAEALGRARPERFIVQRRFDPILDESGASTNHGVYLVAGVASGLFCRVQRGPTDRRARTVAALVDGP